MEISIHAKVNCIDGHIGTVSHVVVNPVRDVISHLVVSYGLMNEMRVVPMNLVTATNRDQVNLRCTREEFRHLPSFYRYEYIEKQVPYYDYMAPEVMYEPVILPLDMTVSVRHENIPADELAVRRGEAVIAVDGAVGWVDELLINPVDEHITHLVLRKGHLWGEREVTVPVDQIDHIEEENIYLKLRRKEIEALPNIPVKRHWL